VDAQGGAHLAQLALDALDALLGLRPVLLHLGLRLGLLAQIRVLESGHARLFTDARLAQHLLDLRVHEFRHV
jgi:hypothetical protein